MEVVTGEEKGTKAVYLCHLDGSHSSNFSASVNRLGSKTDGFSSCSVHILEYEYHAAIIMI